MTLTPFPWPGLDVPNASFSTDGCVCVVGCVCWCFNAFVRRFVTGTSRFRRGCSTGNTLRRFFGSFERACHIQTKRNQTEKAFIIGLNEYSSEKMKIKKEKNKTEKTRKRQYQSIIMYNIPIYLRMRIEHRKIANDDWHG